MHRVLILTYEYLVLVNRQHCGFTTGSELHCCMCRWYLPDLLVLQKTFYKEKDTWGETLQATTEAARFN